MLDYRPLGGGAVMEILLGLSSTLLKEVPASPPALRLHPLTGKLLSWAKILLHMHTHAHMCVLHECNAEIRVN